MTSCTCCTGTPKNSLFRKNVQNCCIFATLSPLLDRQQLARVRGRDQSRNVKNVGNALLDDGRTLHPSAARLALHDKGLFENVQNAVDYQAHAVSPVGVDDDLQGFLPACVLRVMALEHLGDAQERHDLAAVLHDFPVSGYFHGIAREFFQTSYQREVYGHSSAFAVLE